MNAEVELEKMIDFLEANWSSTPTQRQNLLLLHEIFEKVKPGSVSKELEDKDDEIYELTREIDSLKYDLEDLQSQLDSERTARQVMQVDAERAKELAVATEALTEKTMDEWDALRVSVQRLSKAISKITG